MRKVLLAILFFAGSVSAEMYRWVDQHGKTHFSDRAPVKQLAEKVELKTPTSSYDGRDVRTRQKDALGIMMQQRESRQETKNLAAKKALREQKIAKRCNRLKDKIKRMHRAGFLYSLDDQGERVALNDEQRMASIEKLQNSIAKNCDQA